ncbi:MAG: hypothetical protein H0V68_08730 [Actinobacteria bacterium]|nr:hypothetical protein [Actinomycetota bacterium]
MSEYSATENGASKPSGHLLFVWSPSGWTLQERDGEAPSAGSTVEDGERVLMVGKIGPSPLPGDRRRCAYTLP